MAEDQAPLSSSEITHRLPTDDGPLNHEAVSNNHTPALSSPQPARAEKRKMDKPPTESKDSLREVVETVVFVVVLVLLLKSFVAEAFVIPTGSMATTLYGYQKNVECPKCHYVFPLNCSDEVEKGLGPITDGTCPNCRYHIEFDRSTFLPTTGDRVLVDKSLYDLFFPPNRFDVVVFKFPKEPQTRAHVQMNYIKRLVGLPGETVAIYGGDLYVSDDFQHPSPAKNLDVREQMQMDDRDSMVVFQHQIIDQTPITEERLKGKKYRILRKPPDKILSMRRIVYDSDFPAEDMAGRLRWLPEPESDWKLDNKNLPRVFKHSGPELSWLRYRNILRDSDAPRLITDFMGYNSARGEQGHNWVPDLVLECDVEVAQDEGSVVLELRKGPDIFQARFNLADGKCTLVRIAAGKEEELGVADSGVKTGSYRLRLANVDERLVVWVNRNLIFGDGVVYDPPRRRGPFADNDLRPASIGVKGNATVEHIKLHRDTYYTTARGGTPGNSDAEPRGDITWKENSRAWSDPNTWDPLRDLTPKTLYVQPEHFLCLGDNSPESSDGRDWGLVPRRLLLGRALLVYWPYDRAGAIR
ncbi:MAG: S26 family signal peptidase [Gemmataceae bacterium]